MDLKFAALPLIFTASVGYAQPPLTGINPTGESFRQSSSFGAQMTLVEQGVAAAQRQQRYPEGKAQRSFSHLQPITQQKSNKVKAILIGAAVGAGIGVVAGAAYCSADCGGGPARGATVFGALGAGIGAVGGALVALAADASP